ncbi:MAG: pinensin family lanthipeptide [Bacteroidota bacterium]
MKKKARLNELKVSSFITSEEDLKANTINGGALVVNPSIIKFSLQCSRPGVCPNTIGGCFTMNVQICNP